MKSLKFLFTILLAGWIVCTVSAQSLEPIELTPGWMDKIRQMAPDRPTAKPKKTRQVLMFSLHTGFNHWVIPHTDAVMKILSEKTNAFELVQSKDIGMFEEDKLKEFDAVILNNNCSIGPGRDLFYDKLGDNKDLSEDERVAKAAQLEQNLISFVTKGGGLMVMHGAIVMQNNSKPFGDMVGGSFDYHPPQQEITLGLMEADHPLLAAFEGRPFIHVDEPYFFNNAYFDYNFRPMLFMDVTKLHSLKEEVPDVIKYVSWIKREGKGRVFYISPSHNAQSFEDPRMLRYLLNGLQYVTGDLKCDDKPVK